MTSIGRLCSSSLVLFFAAMSTTHTGIATAQTVAPAKAPTAQPTPKPTKSPSTAKHTKAPTVQRTAKPTKLPTTSPTFTSSVTPTPALGNATAVEAGHLHTCALLSGGSVRCWGLNGWGELGDGTTTYSRLSPVSVISLGGAATAVTAGAHHTCALLSGGSVRCWGDNSYGSLGDGTSLSTLTPVSVIDLGGAATAITAGDSQTCALLSDGSVRCWGANGSGGLGDGTTIQRRSPVSVVDLGGAATAVAAGTWHTCALLSDGSVKCWGYNGSGQLGDGTTTTRTSPVSVMSLGGAATAVTAGYEHTCALLSGGSVMCWGVNERGQLGDGTTYSRLSPVSVISLGGAATAVVAGVHHTCALLSGGSVRCWGWNGWGELGDGTERRTNYPFCVTSPVSVIDLGGAATAVAAGFHTCALLSGGSVRCWGYNQYGELGDGTTIHRLSPVSVATG